MNSDLRAHAIDANVIVRYVMGDGEDLFAKSVAILQTIETGDGIIVCDPVQLAETVWVLSSYYELGNAEISEALLPIIQADGFVIANKARYVRALRLFADTVKHFGDACACATALEDCDGLLDSFDRALSSVPGILRAEEPTGLA